MLALIIHLFGSAVGVHSSSFMCSLSGFMKMLLLPSNCSLRPQASYGGLVFTHTRKKALKMYSDNSENSADKIPQDDKGISKPDEF